jgi:hypothetical protein
MEIVLAIALIVIGGLIAWGGISGRIPYMIRSLA